MRLLTLFIVLLLTPLFGKGIEADYKVSYGIFGRVGTAKATMEYNETDYRITIEGRATGLASTLSGGRIERYESIGRVVNGRFVPYLFIKIRRNKNKESVKKFTFDHYRKKVKIEKRNYKHGKLVAVGRSELPYYAPDDLLTLYFNLRKELPSLDGSQRFYAVGGDRKSGAVDIIIPEGEELKRLKKLLKVDGLYLIVVIHQKIFASKEGRLYVVLDEDGIAKRALLKDVIMFGDIRGKLVRKEIYE
ncbi:MAG: DUF3108 domain-containing protein [Epsilonproteobacteria bacterium]|nr:hypothetical protein [Campylobacterota bacterium]NPA56104.1 DUF3108 domain-containing protein [Campylobacterota bacterium]